MRIFHNFFHPSLEVRKRSLVFFDAYFFKKKFIRVTREDLRDQIEREGVVSEIMHDFFQKIDESYVEMTSGMAIEVKAFVKP